MTSGVSRNPMGGGGGGGGVINGSDLHCAVQLVNFFGRPRAQELPSLPLQCAVEIRRHDHVSIVMDAGSRIVNFIHDGTVFA